MAGSRAIGRDVNFYIFSEPGKAIGGLRLNPSITEKNFLSMLSILIVASGRYRVTLRSTGVDLMPTENGLRPGDYDIRPYLARSCIDTVSITDEPCITRILSRIITGRDDIFRARVRERDGKCVITGIVNTKAYRDVWTGFEAAHIFPLSSEEYFVQNGFSRWITNRMNPHDTGINSCQNGLLMQSNIHQSFDSFDFSIDPDNGYKIICFDEDPFRIDGRTLDPVCARDELLRWHFRQAVFANMRGVGEPTFEMDFPPGTDMVGEILKLSLRLNGVYIAQESKS
ncbi:HNH endonuclease-domain-containing protein [Lipomyces kononenkoae]